MSPLGFLSFVVSATVTASVVATASGETADGTSTRKFVWLSDLHYDPYYGRDGAESWINGECASSDAPSRGARGCDSPLSLVESAVLAAAEAASPSASSGKGDDDGPEFVLLTGDFARHGMEFTDDAAEVARTVYRELASLLDRSFPGTSVVIALGNNDATSDYYLNVEEESNPEKNGTQLTVAADAFGSLFHTDEERMTFRSGGYYAHDTGVGVTVVSLNTVIYSVNHMPAVQQEEMVDDPLGQLAWLESELGAARDENRRVMIAGHIPPTVGSYRKAQFWQDRYQRRYFDLLKAFSDVVAAQLFGHLHSDEFRVFPNGGSKADVDADADSGNDSSFLPPVLITASVTPVFGGNPSFRVAEYDARSGNILDYDVHYLDLDVDSTDSWRKLYSFRETYGVEDASSRSMRTILDSLRSSTEDMDGFLHRLKAGVENDPCDDRCRAEWGCVLTAATRAEYDACAPPQKASWRGGASFPPMSNAAMLAIAAGAAAAVVFCLAVWCRSRRRKVLYEDVESYNIDASDDVSV